MDEKIWGSLLVKLIEKDAQNRLLIKILVKLLIEKGVFTGDEWESKGAELECKYEEIAKELMNDITAALLSKNQKEEPS